MVDLAVADAGAERALEIDCDERDIGPAEIVDHDVVRPAQGVEVDPLDVVEVHGDIVDVAKEDDPRTVGRNSDVLVVAGTDEEELIEAVLALDRVVAAARTPNEQVVARTEKRRIVPLPAGDDVIAVARPQDVDALAADDKVVAGPGVDGQLLYGSGRQSNCADCVIATESVDLKLIVRRLGTAYADEGR